MMKPVLSIVIANFNYGRFIESAIRSIVNQNCDDVELIVVDGGSTDNSVEVIKKYASRISWWVSEKDTGQSNAFNKGFSHARGKFLTWVNADDVLVPGCLAKVVHELKAHPHCEWFTGNFLRFGTEGRVLEIGWGPHWYPKWLQHAHSPMVIFGPSTFFSKDLWARTGKLNEALHFMMDTEMWMRFMRDGVKQRRISCFVWAFRMHEESKTAEFGEHKMDVEKQRRFDAEAVDTLRRTQYRCSRFLRLLMWCVRLCDGSMLRRFWLQLTLKYFDGGVS